MNEQERARRDLMILRKMIARIRSIPTGSDDDAVCERMALHAEWNNDVEKVARLDLAARNGDLSLAHLDELAEVARELTDLLPVMRARRYHLPDPEALARVAGRSAAQTT